MQPLNKKSKRSAALELLKARGVPASEAAPLLHRLLWRCGIDVPPPHFSSFWFNAALTGGFCGLGWGLIMWLFFWSRQSMPVLLALLITVLFGFFMGLMMASICRHTARAAQVPSWREFEG